MSIFQNAIALQARENPRCLLTGDFNINLLDYDTCVAAQGFLDMIFSHSFLPLIDKPTRITKTSATLIDNIFTNILPLPKSQILISDISDHLPIFTSIPFSDSHPSRFHPAKSYVYTDASLGNLHRHLQSADWSPVYETDNPNIAFDNLMTIFNNIHHANIPMSTKRHNTKHIPKSPRITNSLLQSINLKNRLFHKFLSKRNSTNHLAYTKNKNILTSVLRSAKKNYFFNQFEREKNNIKNTWKLINTVINKDVSQQKISGITHNGIYTENSSSISEHFNNYFANIGPSLASKIPPCNSNFMSYLGIPNPHSIFLDPVTTEEVCDVVANLANKKSSGSDSINAFVIKRVIPAIVIPLTFIVNQSFSLGIFPDAMKIPKVTPT